jgi:hypothetical protein
MSNSMSNIVPHTNPMIDDTSAAKAIEVAAMLGDSVVDVKHCTDPKAGKVTTKTWGLAAAGLACVLFSTAAFVSSVNTAARNKGRFDYWTQVAKKPAGAFRAEQLSFGYDWVAFGGMALGVGALAGALLRSRRERRSPYYKIGTAPDVTLPITGAPTESFPLVAPRGDDFVLNFGAGMTGEMMVNGRSVPFAELAASGHARPSTAIAGAFELPIPMNSKIKATVGQTSFLVAGVVKPREQVSPLFASLESKTMAYFAGSLAAHLGLVLLLAQMPIDGGSAAIDLAAMEPTSLSGDNKMNEDVPPEEQDQEHGGGGKEAAAAATMELDEGAAGTTKSNRTDSHIRIKDNNADPQVARLQAIEEARTAGVLGSVSLQSGDYFASLTSTGNLSSGFDPTNTYGALFGADGEGAGYFGYGRSGFGAGGGCPPGNQCGIIGTPGGYGKIGLGKFGRDGYAGLGNGGTGIRRHNPGVPTPRIGEAKAGPGYDKQIIRRYIRRNIQKIAYCYEKELLAKPELSGTVTVQFFIAPNGTVATSTGSGVDPNVANCVADVVKAIEFPKPDSGGVQVSYPFIVRPSGA